MLHGLPQPPAPPDSHTAWAVIWGREINKQISALSKGTSGKPELFCENREPSAVLERPLSSEEAPRSGPELHLLPELPPFPITDRTVPAPPPFGTRRALGHSPPAGAGRGRAGQPPAPSPVPVVPPRLGAEPPPPPASERRQHGPAGGCCRCPWPPQHRRGRSWGRRQGPPRCGAAPSRAGRAGLEGGEGRGCGQRCAFITAPGKRQVGY